MSLVENPSREMQIMLLKNRLQETDYKALKYSEGWLTDEEYAETKAERQRIRDEINRLEEELSVGEGEVNNE